jgi:hypothetical protein
VGELMKRILEQSELLRAHNCWKSEGDDVKRPNCILYLWRNEGQLYTLCHSVISLGSNVPGTNLGQQCSRMTHIKAAVTGIAVPVDTLSNKILLSQPLNDLISYS